MTVVEIPLPWQLPPLSMNDRRNRWSNASTIKRVRRDVYLLALSHQLHVGGPWPHVEVTLHYAPRTRGVRDEDNLMATLKPAADGLVSARVVVDDCAPHMVKHMPVIHEATGETGRMWLVVELHQDPVPVPA